MGFTMSSLPDYENPPVVEVAMGVQFAPLEGLSVAHIGLYWRTIRDVFLRCEEQPPIPPVVENLAAPEVGSRMMFQVGGKPDMPRVWFLNQSGEQMVQIQRDRFVHNWRKMPSGEAYPRYPAVKKHFEKYWAGFCKFLQSEGLPHPQVDQLELAYVNHIKQGEGWQSLADIQNLFTTFKWRTRSDFLPPPENVRWSMKFLLPDDMGRLHVDAMPVRIQEDKSLVMSLSLTVRGKPADAVADTGTRAWFDLAREWIVKGFADLADKETDLLWKKQP